MVNFPSSGAGVFRVIGLGSIGLLCLAYALREAGAIRQLLSSKTTDVFSLTTGITGPISISGIATRYEDELVSPFTGTDCFAFEYEVQERDIRTDSTTDGNSNTTWEQIDSGHAAVPFLLEDDTGTVLVDPTQVRFGLDTSEKIHVDGGDRPPAHIQQFIEADPDVDSEEHTIDLQIFEFKTGDDRRYIERRLDPGETVTVFGEAQNSPGISTRSGQVNSIISAGKHPLVLSETTPYRTILRVYWYVFLVAVFGVVFLYIAIAPLIA